MYDSMMIRHRWHSRLWLPALLCALTRSVAQKSCARLSGSTNQQLTINSTYLVGTNGSLALLASVGAHACGAAAAATASPLLQLVGAQPLAPAPGLSVTVDVTRVAVTSEPQSSMQLLAVASSACTREARPDAAPPTRMALDAWAMPRPAHVPTPR